MALKDLRSVLKAGHDLPINGKTYHVPPVSAEIGLKFQDFITVAIRATKADQDGIEYQPTAEDIEVLSDQQERNLYREVLVDGLWEEMTDDGLTFEELKMAAMYALLYAVQGEPLADKYWASGGKAVAPNRAARRTATRTRTAAANTTRKQG